LVDRFLDDPAQPIPCAEPDPRRPPAQAPAGAAERQAEAAAPRNETERQLVAIWERVLGTRPVGIRDDYFELGGSSWQAVRLFAEMQQALGAALPLHTLVEAPTVEQLAAALRQRQESAPWTPLVPIQPNGSRPPFYCVHGAGGHVVLFERLARRLGDDQPFYAFQARGLEGGQEPFTRIEDIAASYVEALLAANPRGPYCLGGYSMGGMVAFEMAQQLGTQGKAVSALVIVDVPAQNPRLRHLRRLADTLTASRGMSGEQALQLFLRLRHYVFRCRYVSRLTSRQRAEYVLRKLARSGGGTGRADARPDEELEVAAGAGDRENGTYDAARRRIRAIYALNERAFQAYIPRPYSGRVSLIRSARGYTGDPDKDYSPDPYLGWGRLIAGEIETYVVPGNHNEMIREPHVQVLARHLRTCLGRAEPERAGAANTQLWETNASD
jgi:thioesterase domain-containing protein